MQRGENIAGWLGVILVLAAFILTTFGVISPKDILYGILNGLGALGIIASSYQKKDFQPIALNAVWLIVAGIGIIRVLLA
jgi:hypothetical protein